MEHEEAAKVLAALAICTERVPLQCEDCPAYDAARGRKEQRKECNRLLAEENVSEAIRAAKDRQSAQTGRPGAVCEDV